MSLVDLMTKPGFFRVRFSAEPENVDFVCERAKNFLLQMNIDRDFDIVLSLREALLNAVFHGSDSNPELVVDCEVAISGFMLTMRVRDEGHGFDWKNVRREKQGSEGTSGRGIKIMECYCNDLEYNEKGNEIVLKKNLLSMAGV